MGKRDHGKIFSHRARGLDYRRCRRTEGNLGRACSRDKDKLMHATLIYDGQCPLCRAAVDWVNARKSDPNLVTLPCQSSERVEQFPDLTERECMESVQFVLEDGSRHAGADSLPHILLRVRGWRWLARVLKLPVISWASPSVYKFISHNRHAISLLVHEKHSECGDDACDTKSDDS